MQACTSLDVDIISLDLARKLPFKLAPSALQAAVERGIYFEVTLSSSSPMLLTTQSSGASCFVWSHKHLWCMVPLSFLHSRS